jgi:diacylglycerol kinase
MYKNLRAKIIVLLVYYFFFIIIRLSTIGQNKLSSLTVLAIEHELIQEINTEKVIDFFANKKYHNKVL